MWQYSGLGLKSDYFRIEICRYAYDNDTTIGLKSDYFRIEMGHQEYESGGGNVS